MNYQINFIPEALTDMKKLDHSVRPQVVKGIQKVSQNPVSIYQGGYGKPLGNKDDSNLTGLFKIKFRGIGIRVVYSVEEKQGVMTIIIVSVRADNQVYQEASKRKSKHNL
ncbi:mRNA interferase RelE [uncultured Roseburia sp.]|uniref:Type II toxin-antitoxin system RelE/ParE family toxin n=1 Tax=Brotonthovivens ammoniilytica TaxID=2981725 RepID=A0ABT2TFY4_9FIRM|nr:type II toxin-antitoxin system RelE/ParE family toxin [Brotonthovivens ammoniilytica]MCU6761103.1 type II toxin-antitoxin system RelE/ParE family toxin [Brotonthovivens ammoniilytica]SCI18944.1 mRNA interferase RelE [uncultured Roseburia sp.]